MIQDKTLKAIVILIDKYQVNVDRCIKQLKELDNKKKWLDKAYSELTDEEKRIVQLKYHKNIGVRKIAYIVKRSKSTVYNMLIEAENKISRII